MHDEVTLLKELGSRVEPVPVEVEERVRRQLLDLIAADRPGTRSHSRLNRRHRLAAGAVVTVAVAVAVALLLFPVHGVAPSIADKAYAAIAPRTGIMHFVAQYGPPSKPRYEEYWIDLARPSRRRIVQSAAGRVSRQLVYSGGYSTVFGQKGPNHNPPTIVIPAPPNPSAIVETGSDPTRIYRKLLHTGTLVSASKITYRGRPAYRLVIDYKPPYKLVGDVWPGERLTYTVDRRTFFPLESKWRNDPTMGGGVSIVRYPKFEILPETPQTRTLLRPAKHPQPYRS